MAKIEHGTKLCSKCKKVVKNYELFHIIVNKGIPSAHINWCDDSTVRRWTADVTYYEENVDSRLFLCEECKNKLMDFICFKEE